MALHTSKPLNWFKDTEQARKHFATKAIIDSLASRMKAEGQFNPFWPGLTGH